MKTLKFIAVLIIAIAFTNVLFADEPQKINKTELAAMMVVKLERDITLTESQKAAIQKIAEEYLDKRQNAALSKTGEAAHSMREEAEKTYKTALENLLTDEQRTTLQAKQEEAKRNSNPENCCN